MITQAVSEVVVRNRARNGALKMFPNVKLAINDYPDEDEQAA
jgi:hypothetical protein